MIVNQGYSFLDVEKGTLFVGVLGYTSEGPRSKFNRYDLLLTRDLIPGFSRSLRLGPILQHLPTGARKYCLVSTMRWMSLGAVELTSVQGKWRRVRQSVGHRWSVHRQQISERRQTVHDHLQSGRLVEHSQSQRFLQWLFAQLVLAFEWRERSLLLATHSAWSDYCLGQCRHQFERRKISSQHLLLAWRGFVLENVGQGQSPRCLF